ncbi:peptidoglycan-binding protein [Agromyces sp. G08B096]|uniref:Peptidoglycan-binding protein n=1 Tax=Agromyces sp. G08B096 TaxID=3156399 RepID=A0AAU7WA29_9MICO
MTDEAPDDRAAPRRGIRIAARAGWLALVAATGAGVVLTAAAAVGFGGEPAADAGASGGLASPATVAVERRDLVATTEQAARVARRSETVVRGHGGVVTWLPAVGTVVEPGGQLARVDDAPVVLIGGSLPAYRPLTPGAEGADVAQFEANLAAFGYAGFEVDDRYTWSTAAAVERWQRDLGVEPTGVVAPDRVQVADGPVEVIARALAVGDPADGVLLTVAGRERVVSVDLDEADRRFAIVGAAVSIRLPDGTTLPGRIEAADSVVEPAAPGSGAEARTVLRLTIVPDDAAMLASAPPSTATVAFEAERVEDVLVVPIGALLALAEGGYAVEVVETDASAERPTSVVGVETGLFAAGSVEVRGALAEGDEVVVAE